MRKILLVVDVQNDFIDPEKGVLVVPGALEIVPAINERINSGEYDAVFATQDWHPADHKSFYTEHPGSKPYDEIDLRGIRQTLWPPHAVAGTWGADFHPALETRRFRFIARKGMNRWLDSYSAFFENDQTTATGLGALIDRDARLDCAGVAADYCLGATALDAVRFCGNVRVLLSCAAGIDPGGVGLMLDSLRTAGVVLVE
ncbi:MAG: nicotinamidase [Treponema sp.]|jgi:nicotinamidase/pyrazinamidase|nr:nicotinamidase [Treponema sp.]